MPIDYATAVETLYRGPLDAFVAERKRLAGELKAAGDKEGGVRLGKLGRPSISAWAVNQLWWQEREAVEQLFAAAKRVKEGKLDAGTAHRETHREALSALRALAAARLASGGHAAAEATMRRVTMTLSALAATGTFAPDPPGALVADRDPPGFEALELRSNEPDEKPASHATETKGQVNDADAKRREQAELERKRAAEERQRLEEERARKKAERARIERELSAAQGEHATHQRDAERLRHELTRAQAKVEKAAASVEKLKEALTALDEVPQPK
jgi:hypothetical protein